MKTIINRKLMKYLESKNIIDDRQYGFRPNRSTGDLLTFVIQKLNSTLHRSGETCIVALDILRLSIVIVHKALIGKCIAIGLGEHLSNWIENYLSNRSIRVLVERFTSNLYEINVGVPQRSVWSPTLFIIFINDLLSLTTNPIYSYSPINCQTQNKSF
jgi:hypothetical protein